MGFAVAGVEGELPAEVMELSAQLKAWHGNAQR